MRWPPPLNGSVGGGQQTSLRRGTISFSVIKRRGWMVEICTYSISRADANLAQARHGVLESDEVESIMYKGKYFTAIVLASGKGKRMHTEIAKQFIHINGYPMVYYSLRAFEESLVDSIILVTSVDDIDYCEKEIVEKYGLTKVHAIVEGGVERYHSTAAGLKACKEETDYVMIHDCARPCLTPKIISDSMESVISHGACTVGVKVTDTICQVNNDNVIVEVPNRNYLWSVQTPQSFIFKEIRKAHEMLAETEPKMTIEDKASITDDVWVWKRFIGRDVRMVEGLYENIKVTNPTDVAKVKKRLI